MEKIKINKQLISGVLITVLVSGILLGIGFVIVNEISKDMPQYPTGAFIIINKEIMTDNTLWIQSYTYLFYFGNGEYDCVGVPQTDYGRYNIGDLYPNTEPRILQAYYPDPSYKLIPYILCGAPVVGLFASIYIYHNSRKIEKVKQDV